MLFNLKYKPISLKKDFMIHLIPMRHFYCVQFLNKSVKTFVIEAISS